jgi:hypothetical protein
MTFSENRHPDFGIMLKKTCSPTATARPDRDQDRVAASRLRMTLRRERRPKLKR